MKNTVFLFRSILIVTMLVFFACGEVEKEPAPVLVSEMSLSKDTLTLFVGGIDTLTATVLPENANDKVVTWSSSNPRIVTVNADGKVTAIAIGTAVITATSGNGKSAICSIAVPTIVPITVNGISFSMVYVQGGTFTMGCTNEQGSDCQMEETPSHRVTLSSFYIGRCEVTQALWQAIMGSNPSYSIGSNFPVERVNWDSSQIFINRLNTITGKTFRLPTEAEWEYAARGGNKSKGYKYSGSNILDDVAWCLNNSDYQLHDVGTKAANELGLYDMSGNAWEWCSDWFDMYSGGSQTNPTGPVSGYLHTCRGGNTGSDVSCRVSCRSYRFVSHTGAGIRLVLFP